MKNSFCVIWLTCPSHDEAECIAQRLLEKKMIACAKFLPIQALFQWRGTIDKGEEILMSVETILEKFDAIEQEVRTMHSYETFVLIAMPLVRVSSKAQQWILESVD